VSPTTFSKISLNFSNKSSAILSYPSAIRSSLMEKQVCNHFTIFSHICLHRIKQQFSILHFVVDTQVPFNIFFPVHVCIRRLYTSTQDFVSHQPRPGHQQENDERKEKEKRKILLPFMKIELSSRINQSFILTIYVLFLSVLPSSSLVLCATTARSPAIDGCLSRYCCWSCSCCCYFDTYRLILHNYLHFCFEHRRSLTVCLYTYISSLYDKKANQLCTHRFLGLQSCAGLLFPTPLSVWPSNVSLELNSTNLYHEIATESNMTTTSFSAYYV
jgi:hypothetical protein